MFGIDKNLIGDFGDDTVKKINKKAYKNIATSSMNNQSERNERVF